MSNCLRDINALQDVFFEDAKPFWRLYQGRSAKGNIIGSNKDDEDMDSSWDKLAARLDLYGDGVFTVAVMNNFATNNNAATLHTVRVGEGASGSHRSESATGGIGSMRDMLYFMEFMDRRNGQGPSIGDIETQISERIELKAEVARLKDELARERKRKGVERVVEIGLEKLPRILDSYFPNQKAVAGVLGSDPKTATRSVQRTTEPATSKRATSERDGEPGDGKLDFNVMVNAGVYLAENVPGQDPNELIAALAELAATVAENMPDVDVCEAINKLKAFIESNPAMAAGFLQ